MSKDKAAAAKPKRTKKIKPFVMRDRTRIEYRFTPTEIGELGRALGDATNQRNTLDEQKKNVVKEYASKIAEKNAQINSLSNKVTSGYEMRDVDCLVEMDRAKRTKTFYLVKDDGKKGAKLSEDRMSDADMCLLPMDNPEPPKGEMPTAKDGSLGTPMGEAMPTDVNDD